MKIPDISRRRFVQVAGAAATTQFPLNGADALTAKAVVQRVQSALGGRWVADGLDGFKAGDPDTPIRGIATTAMATMDVLKQAVQNDVNLILTHEPTFFGRQDGPVPPRPAGGPGGRPGDFPGLSADDPVYLAKKEFIDKNGLVVFRLHDNWLSRRSSDMTAGLAEVLGWAKNRVRPDDGLYDVTAATAEETVALLREKLKLRGGLRAVGNRTATVKRVLLLPGFTTPAVMRKRYREADLTITGEVREWENTFYAADLFTAGERRGLVTVGRVVSEDPGMRSCAEWLKTVVPETPVQWIPAGDLYWRAV
jgi:putative NIF3 family GTP cyclohydrolase 1 type 2